MNYIQKTVSVIYKKTTMLVAYCDYNYESRITAHGIKDCDMQSIESAAKRMAPMIPANSVLIPIPSHKGESSYTYVLASKIAAIRRDDCIECIDALKGSVRQSSYILKLHGYNPKPEDLGLELVQSIPNGFNVIFIDNVIDTGTTAEAAARLVDYKCSVYAYAMTDVLLK